MASERKVAAKHKKHSVEWRVSTRKNLGAAAANEYEDYAGTRRRKDPPATYVVTVKEGMAGAWVKEKGDKTRVYLVEVFVDGARVDHTFKDDWCAMCKIGVEVTRSFHQKWAYSDAKGWHATQYQLKSETVARKPYGMEKLTGNPNQ